MIFGIYGLHHNASVWGDDVEVCVLMDNGWGHIVQWHLMESNFTRNFNPSVMHL